jgi:outer membrane protein OmpA-like peptidoglycan-associated protein
VLTRKSEEQLNVLNTRITRLRKQLGMPNEPQVRGLGGLMLAGCAAWAVAPAIQRAALQQAGSDFQKVKEDSNVLRIAPKDVIRAGESWPAPIVCPATGAAVGRGALRLPEPALQRNRPRAHRSGAQRRARGKLELERQRLQLALRESKLLSVQQQGKWLEEQIALATTQTDRGLVMTLGDVLFDTGEADLKNSANRTVLKIVQFLQLNPKRVVRIEGYTDSTGGEQENLKLSRDRAQSVADVLVDLGSTKNASGRRLRRPVPGGRQRFRAGRAQNRRVEIVFSDEKGQLGAAR